MKTDVLICSSMLRAGSSVPQECVEAATVDSMDINTKPRLAAILLSRLYSCGVEEGELRGGERAKQCESHPRHGGRYIKLPPGSAPRRAENHSLGDRAWLPRP